ncbi:MAG: DNA polymerase III subunit delta [Candidatus Dadabacteria bacterium]|nr:MAG: DNA polymerase III subunit delta [Candidatus Dadabacteria bacterium]
MVAQFEAALHAVKRSNLPPAWSLHGVVYRYVIHLIHRHSPLQIPLALPQANLYITVKIFNPIMKDAFKDLLDQIIAKKRKPHALLVLCKDRIRAKRTVDYLVKGFFEKHFQSADIPAEAIVKLPISRIKSEGSGILAEQLQSVSLFSQFKIVIVKNCEEATEKLSREVASLIEKPLESTCVIFVAAKLPASNALRKLLTKQKLVITLPELKGYELKRWTKREFKLAGITKPTEQAVNAVIAIAKNSPDKISQLVEHLSLYSDSAELDSDQVYSLFIEEQDPNEFKLLDQITSGNQMAAEVELAKLLGSGKNPFILLSLIQRAFSNYLIIRARLNKSDSPAILRQKLNMNQWVFNKNLQAAKKYSLHRLDRSLGAVLKADSKLKNRSLGADLILSELLEGLSPGR